MRRVISLWLPMLAIDRIARASPAAAPPDRACPQVVVDWQGQQQVIVAVAPAAAAIGLRPGMPLAKARAMVGQLDVRPADPAGDAAILDGIVAHAIRRWTPLAAPESPDGVWLDVTGATALAGGEERLARTIRRSLARAGLTVRLAMADCYGAAHALARHTDAPVTIVPPGAHVQAILGLPIAALRLQQSALAMLARFGVERVADLLAMPRAPLVRRFGQALVTRLDQATGRAAEPLPAVQLTRLPMAQRRLAEPIGHPESIASVIAALVADLAACLAERGLGARRIALRVERVDGACQAVVAGLAHASRDAAHLDRLLQARVETINPGFGIDAMVLTALATEPLAPAQVAGEEDTTDLAPLVDRLAGRLGAARIWRAAPVESDVPERCLSRVDPLAPATGGDPWPAHWPRPVRLLDPPEAVTAAMTLLPDGAPARFTWRRCEHRVVRADGPERIHGEWWKRTAEALAVRDYYRIEDDRGERFWLYRRGDGVDPATGDLGWHVHGVFA